MLVTVAICTWNRAKLLDRTLTRMRELIIPEGIEWELLVVNNNCVDDTDQVIVKHNGSLPIRRLMEPKQGLSNARNAAVENARGELLLWTDDDVLICSGWLKGYLDASTRWPEAAYFGGLIQPWFETPPSRWMSENLKCFEGLLVIRDFGPEERPFQKNEQPFGANMAFRTSKLRQLPFDPHLGRIENRCILGEETQVLQALNRQGCFGIWVPQARVQHFVPRARLRLKYIWQYFKGLGQTTIRMEGYVQSTPFLLGAPRWLYRRYWEKLCRAWLLRLACNDGWITDYFQAAHCAGMIEEIRDCRRF